MIVFSRSPVHFAYAEYFEVGLSEGPTCRLLLPLNDRARFCDKGKTKSRTRLVPLRPLSRWPERFRVRVAEVFIGSPSPNAVKDFHPGRNPRVTGTKRKRVGRVAHRPSVFGHTRLRFVLVSLLQNRSRCCPSPPIPLPQQVWALVSTHLNSPSLGRVEAEERGFGEGIGR